MHFCQDEALAIAASFPFIGYFVMRFKLAWRGLFRRKRKCTCCTSGDGCDCERHCSAHKPFKPEV